VGRGDLGFLISDFGLGTLLRSVSVNLAELRRAPATGGAQTRSAKARSGWGKGAIRMDMEDPAWVTQLVHWGGALLYFLCSVFSSNGSSFPGKRNIKNINVPPMSSIFGIATSTCEYFQHQKTPGI
jgi:hypothetical protein